MILVLMTFADFPVRKGTVTAAHICTCVLLILASDCFYNFVPFHFMSEQTLPQPGPQIESTQQPTLPLPHQYQSTPPVVSFRVFKPTDTVTRLLGELTWSSTHRLANIAPRSAVAR